MRNKDELGGRCKRHESPRKGSKRNSKGKGGKARLRQLRKREKRLRLKLKASTSNGEGGGHSDLPFFSIVEP